VGSRPLGCFAEADLGIPDQPAIRHAKSNASSLFAAAISQLDY